MATWRKILVSGSNAHIAAITASVMGDITDKAQAVFRAPSTGQFFSTASIFFTASGAPTGPQLYLDKTGFRALNISASGLPDSVQTNSTVIFHNDDTSGLQTTSSLFFNNSGQLEFSSSIGVGTFSGSFQGDGSGLTGVVGTLAQTFNSGDGIISSSGEVFAYDGTSQVTAQVNLATNSGLEFASQALRLNQSLAGAGLYFPGLNDLNFSTMSIALTPGGTSGLTTGSDPLNLAGTLAVTSSIAGSGLAFNTGQINIDLATDSGLQLDADELKLADDLDGIGLTYTTPNSVLAVDTNFAVTSASRVTFETGSNNLLLTVSPDADLTTSSRGFSQKLINDPVVTYDLNTTLTGDFTFQNNINVEGNFTVSGSLISASLETENLNIADQFILINSGSIGGSGGGDGGIVVMASNSNQGTGAFLFYDSHSARWGVSDVNQGINSESHRVTDNDHAAIVTTTIINSPESVLLNSTPLFGNSDATKMGQLAITTAASSSESSIFIYA